MFPFDLNIHVLVMTKRISPAFLEITKLNHGAMGYINVKLYVKLYVTNLYQRVQISIKFFLYNWG